MLSAADRPVELCRLVEMVHAIEAGGGDRPCRPAAAFFHSPGAPALIQGIVHEWLGPEDAAPPGWAPPLCILAHAAGRLIAHWGWAAWIGRRCWPRPWALAGGG